MQGICPQNDAEVGDEKGGLETTVDEFLAVWFLLAEVTIDLRVDQLDSVDSVKRDYLRHNIVNHGRICWKLELLPEQWSKDEDLRRR